MTKRTKKFLSYYKPYLGLFAADMFFALLASLISLVYPMIVRYITNNVLVNYDISEAAPVIIKLLFAMLGLAALEYACTYFTVYKGHMMGAKMEYDMRNDIFEHLQKLSFSFYDNQKTGQLMSRIANDLFDVTELCHHGPEDIFISLNQVCRSLCHTDTGKCAAHNDSLCVYSDHVRICRIHERQDA